MLSVFIVHHVIIIHYTSCYQYSLYIMLSVFIVHHVISIHCTSCYQYSLYITLSIYIVHHVISIFIVHHVELNRIENVQQSVSGVSPKLLNPFA